MCDVSVCIVNWNTRELLLDCLSSIYAHPWQVSLEVIVVDNASEDGSPDMVQQQFSRVHLIANEENVGFARANNQAMAVGTGRYFLLLNSDTIVLPHSFDRLVQFLDGEPAAGMVGARLLNPDRSLQRSCWRGYPSLQTAVVDAFYLWRLAPNFSWVRASEISDQELEQTIVVDHILGACMLVRREVYEQIGGMEESIFLFLEETEWCFRCQQAGWEIYYYPEAEIVHLGQQSVRKNPERTLPEKYRNYLWFYQNYRSDSRLNVLILRLIIVWAAGIRIALWTWRSRHHDRRELAHRMRRGYWAVVKLFLRFARNKRC
jgi:GT2 family glycosyltransferase